MKTTKPHELLRVYAQDHSESAFQELVNRYVDLVYSAAIRRVSGDRQLAEDVTQEVFANLARKAAALPPNVMLGGWLLRHTGYVASTAMRGEQRRRDRERQAVEMNALNEPTEGGWRQFAPMLDEAMDEMDEADRDALVLRYFEQYDLRSVGEALGTTEDAAQKRVSRALEKLQTLLKHRGATVSAAALGTALATEAVTAAPIGLAASISATALASVTPLGVSGFLAKTLVLMSIPKLTALIILIALALTLIGTYRSSNSRKPGPPSGAIYSESGPTSEKSPTLATRVQRGSHARQQTRDLQDLTANLHNVLHGPITNEDGFADNSKIIAALRAFGPEMEAAVPVLIDGLTDRESTVRQMASWGFHYMGRRADEAIPTLIQLFNSPTQPSHVRVSALEALSSIGSNGGGVRPADPTSISVAMQDVLNLLGDPDPGIRAQASITLASMGTYTKPAVPSLVSAIEAENIQTRILAANTLGQIGPPAQEAVPALAKLLTYSASKEDALAQLTASGQNPLQISEAALSAKLDALTRSARAAGVVALGRIGPGAEDSVPALIAIMNNTADGVQPAPSVENQIPFYPMPQDNSESELRVKAAIALWQVTGRGDGAKLIAETLYPPRPDLGWWDERLNVLGEMGPAAQAAVPILQAMGSSWVRDDPFHVRARLLAALPKIAPEPPSSTSESSP